MEKYFESVVSFSLSNLKIFVSLKFLCTLLKFYSCLMKLCFLEFILFNPTYEKFPSPSSISDNSCLEVELFFETTSFSFRTTPLDLAFFSLLVVCDSTKDLGFYGGLLIALVILLTVSIELI